MQLILCVLCLLLAGGAYYFYADDQERITADRLSQTQVTDLKTKADAAQSQIQSLSDTNKSLEKSVEILKAQLSNAETALDVTRSATPSKPIEASTRTGAPSLPDSIPSTITTLSGHTYLNCKLSRVFPDGISFTHSLGSAKVPFTDLDPSFSRDFHSDPTAAQSSKPTSDKSSPAAP